jgi:hypothetical protein
MTQQLRLFQSLPYRQGRETRNQWEDRVWHELLGRLGITAEQVSMVVSPNERKNILYRALAISRLLAEGRPMEISRELWLSRQTIYAIKKGMTDKAYKSSRARGHKKRVVSWDMFGSESRKEFHPYGYHKTKYGKIKKR